MSLKLSKTDVEPYDYISLDSSFTNPTICSGTLTREGGVTTTDTTNIYLVATRSDTPAILFYDEIELSISSATTGITLQVSDDESSWDTTININSIDCSIEDVVIPIYIRALLDNSEATPLEVAIYNDNFTLSCVAKPVVPEIPV